MAAANREMWVAALLEDREAVQENLDGILSTPGLDAASIGHVDLSQSMGHPGDWNHPEVAAAINKAYEKIEKAGKGAGRNLAFTTSITFLIKAGAKEFIAKAKGNG
jgi:4-hydroxy-2-oxoheptanedioate aldolase